ncbi:MAG: hypothetical protein FWD25_06440 [Clostridia bacterium]|nr:hypothetical protein [Clostridia bacterium]
MQRQRSHILHTMIKPDCPSVRLPSWTAPAPSLFRPLSYDDSLDADGQGLLCYQNHWYLRDADVKVRNELLCGIPIGLKGNTLCLINKEFRYFIPLNRVDYIRTAEGLESGFGDDSE